jgi:hypothetical protein
LNGWESLLKCESQVAKSSCPNQGILKGEVSLYH